MNFIDIEKKWQKIWAEKNQHRFNFDNISNKKYVLEMLPYPSGAKLHVGHWYNYGPSDTYARFKKLQGYEVFQPMGFDAFGLPAENYAIKTGIHPKESTYKNIKSMHNTLNEMGAMFDWEQEIITCDPSYYKWTQWLFLKFYENGLAYRKNAPVNWCESCNTVLANEQVIDGECERCSNVIVRKNLTQWFFKITEYAEELLNYIDDLNWPEKTKAMQRNWIGKSTGAEIEFKVYQKDVSFKVFTTRIDTLYGVSYVVLAPEHELVAKLTTPEYKKQVDEYISKTSKLKEIDRLSATREKTGQFIGSYVLNPANNKKIEIWISDYVLASYGTGAVMGVPAHDERDFEFATKYNLDITRVVKAKCKDEDDQLPFSKYGISVNSGKFSDLSTEECQKKLLEYAKLNNFGEAKIQYRLRDWLVSRQRYWGCPIPIVHCDKCGEVPIKLDDLPVELPNSVDFKPDGESPLKKCDEFMNTKCPKCGMPAKRDPDTLDTFVCSSWYFLRYVDNKNTKEPFNSELINKMLPVDKYIGGAEHACMHLLYARFFTKALRDLKLLNFNEPFISLVHQGTILGPDGHKMSKSKGNVISPDDYVRKYGSDAFRMYLMFGFSYIEGGPWSSTGIDAIVRFLDKVEKFIKAKDEFLSKQNKKTPLDSDLLYTLNNTIKSVGEDIEKFSFNTAIARLMELSNILNKYVAQNEINRDLYIDTINKMVVLIAPFAPHFAEELNYLLGNTNSIFDSKFPEYNEKALIRDEYELAVQINSKIKGKILVENSLDNKKIEELALEQNFVKDACKDKKIVKVIIIPRRLVNIVIK